MGMGLLGHWNWYKMVKFSILFRKMQIRFVKSKCRVVDHKSNPHDFK